VVLLHVAVAFWFVAGLLGRNLTLLLYVPLFALVPLVFVPRGRVFDRALAEATARGEVTPALSLALRDPVVAAARAAELVVLAAVVVLMVVKPF
jgi:hypothetical protein